MNNLLNKKLLSILEKEINCSTNSLCAFLQTDYTRIQIKEELILLLKEKKIRNSGSRWYITEKTDTSISEQNGIEFYAECPHCTMRYSILSEYVNNKVQCQNCNTKFLISDEMISENEYKTLSLGD